MATKEIRDSWISKSTASPSEVLLNVHGRQYCLNKKYLVARSGKLGVLLLKENQNEESQAHTLKDIPGGSVTFYLAMRFCYGFEPNLTAENVIPLICLSHHLEMTENHSPGNLLNKTLNFFQLKVLPLWDESIKAYQATEQVLQQAGHLGLLDACLDSLLGKAHLNPRLLGEPIKIKNPTATYYDDHEDEDSNDYRPNARKRLFFPTNYCQSAQGNLTELNLRLYELLMTKMIQCGIPSEYVAGSLFRYAKKWAINAAGNEGVLSCKNSYAREVIEIVEKLLPDEKGLLSCKLLFQMLQSAITLQASSNCRYGFENRIGKQLDKAKVEDLMIPLQGRYAMEIQYDTECVKRILKNFYSNYTCSDPSGLIKVADLIEEFLAKVASDVQLTKDKFMSLAAMSVATSVEPKRFSDGIYRAVDVYLDKHRYLSKSESEEVCEVLDCYKMSPEACTHASQNERLPLRVRVQAMFVGQLQLKEAISSRTEDSISSGGGGGGGGGGSREEEEAVVVGDGEEVKIGMEKMDDRVIELEKEYSKMRKQIIEKGEVKEKGSSSSSSSSKWKAWKRKFGCISSSSIHDNNCQVKKKVNPRNAVKLCSQIK